MFSSNLFLSWKLLDLYGKKTEDYAGIQKLFLEILSDFPAMKLNRVLKKYMKTKSVFPKPAQLAEMVEEEDYDLTKKEQRFRVIYGRARARNNKLYQLIESQEKELESFEENYQRINTDKGWAEEYDAIFNQSNKE